MSPEPQAQSASRKVDPFASPSSAGPGAAPQAEPALGPVLGPGSGGQRADAAGAAQLMSHYADPPAPGAATQAGGEAGAFEAKFQDTFREIKGAEPFKALLGKPGDLAALFSPEQQAMLLRYMDSKIIPPGLFTDEPHNKSSGPQRILIASNMLAHGKIKFKGELMDGEKWCASCCNGWAAGVIAYAGANPGAGYGASSSEQSISPTGEKSYGAGQQDTVKGSNVTADDVAEAMKRESPYKQKVKDAEAALAKAIKAKDPAAEATARADLDAARAELKLPQQEAGKEKVRVGASATGSGHTPLSFDAVTRELQAGDWVYIDNGGAAGHSVIFVEWASDTKHESDTAPETGETRQVSYRVAHTYSQRKPKLGGTFDTYKIGFPYSKKHKVYPAYSIVNARQDAQVASSSEQLLNYDVDAAMSANGAILGNEKHNLDAAAVRQKLLGVVQGLVSGMHEQHRTQDHKGEARGDFSAPQRAVVDAILAGSGNVERDIADLVALGQKLSLINVVHGDPTRPNGKLAQGMSGGTWTAPWPAWGKDPTLRKQP